MKYLKTMLVVSESDVRRYGITCKCGERMVVEVLSFTLDNDCVIVSKCEKCGQNYGLHQHSLWRIDENYQPIKMIVSNVKVERGSAPTEASKEKDLIDRINDMIQWGGIKGGNA